MGPPPVVLIPAVKAEIRIKRPPREGPPQSLGRGEERESYTTVFKPTFLVRGFSLVHYPHYYPDYRGVGITAESGQGRETPNMRDFYN